MFDLPSIFDGIGEAFDRVLFRPATWIPKGGQPVPVRVDFEAPHLKVDALGIEVNAVQAFAMGLCTTFAAAQAGDVLVIGGRQWALKTGPEPYGGGNLCRMELSGPLRA